MIALNTATGIIEINCWQDIEERPHFRTNIDPTNVELREIIGSYQFDSDVRCGLSTCHQPHKRGYIVMTKDGWETNIGKDCGKNYFSVDFVEMKVKFDRDVKRSIQRDTIKNAKEKAPELLDIVNQLRKQHHGADWIYQKIAKLRNRSDIGEIPASELRKMLKERRKELLASRKASKKEREEAFARDPSLEDKYEGKPYFITTVVGSINYIEAMSKEHDLKETLIRDVSRTLNVLIDSNLESIRDRDLSLLAKDANAVEAKIQKAKESIEIGRRFLTKENLTPLAEWIANTFGERHSLQLLRFIEQL
ncbi:hypothetical protein [Hafnia paralvei]|uniref:hypothetical protein n=1 Tax=Hafnia paralvei TaxID=546367 RepID=UPI001F440DBD|nr:hypothetical protein [Hafnia paralvei]MCE9902378.1 hypothetical protein [Hafnia paralvei]MCE9922323.1 hypothetical protein [Hafnia paralvei]